MGTFVCVFSQEDSQSLEEMGYTFWRKHDNVYIFINDGQGDLSKVEHLMTNRMFFEGGERG